MRDVRCPFPHTSMEDTMTHRNRNVVRLLVLVVLLTVWLSYWRWHSNWRRHAPKTQKITCVNNLRALGLAFRIWSGDHSNQYPFHLSTNAGGTMELCMRNSDGFDMSAAFHLQVLSNELNTPLVLVCPEDQAKKAATSFESLKPENVTYRLRSGSDTAETNTTAVLAVCPVDGNTLRCDGSVLDAQGKEIPRWPPRD